MKCIIVIFLKELTQLLRDRRTLMLIVGIPMIVIPLLLASLERMRERTRRQQATQTVRILASAETQNRYSELIYDWFRQTNTSKALMEAQSVSQGGVFDNDVSRLLGESFSDSEGFRKWIRRLADFARDQVGSNSTDRERRLELLQPHLKREIIDFARIAIQGFARIEFVDYTSSSLAEFEGKGNGLSSANSSLANADSIANAIRSKYVDGFLEIPQADLDSGSPVMVQLMYDSTRGASHDVYRRFEYALRKAGQNVARNSLSGNGDFVEPVQIQDGGIDLATSEEMHRVQLEVMLPFLIMIFLSVGSLHSAVEISVGEKIANTLEPLLITPVHRWELAIGKYFVVFAVTVFVTIGGVFSTLFSTALISGDSAVQGLDFESGVSGLLLILPSAAAVAGLFLAISMAARSTREAHIWITPLNFMLITAGLAPRLFGTQLSWTTVLIPFVNVSVMSGQLLSRSLPVEYYVGATFSSVLFALFCIAIVVRQFHREDVLFRT